MAVSVGKNLLCSSGEFEALPYRESDTSLCSTGFRNMHKNRYSNILPPDATRIVLQDGGYINANMIDLGGMFMIACQGPTDETIEDFWTMILQHRTPAILMLTPLIEREKVKCACYWPKVGSIAKYGSITVLGVSSNTLTDTLTVSKLLVLRRQSRGELLPFGFEFNMVYHIHYTGMPDFGVADCEEILLVISLLISVLEDDRPFVCHCSAGVGRTGVFAAILRCLKTNETPVAAIRSLRVQRHGMVQNRAQFRKVKEFLSYLYT